MKNMIMYIKHRFESIGQTPPNNQATTTDAATLQLAQQIAQQLLADQQNTQRMSKNGQVYSKFNMLDDVVTTQNETVTAGVWSDGISSLTTHFSSSAQTNTQRRYYVDVYQENPSNEGSAVQYSVAYGHALGSGSNSEGQLNDSPSRAIYSQYRQLLLAAGDTRFTTGNGSTDSIYVINFKRNRLKERLDPGNFELPIRAVTTRDVNGSGSVSFHASNVITLIDDSSEASITVGESGKVYNIVSGSINNGIYKSGGNPVYYGLAYPDHGILVIDGTKLDSAINFSTNVSSSSEGNNHFVLYQSISSSALLTSPYSDPYGFLARNSEQINSTHYFVRIKNAEFNFSNNPSFATGSDGAVAQSSFLGDPKTYVTTVGLYNDQYELLAVAKLSKPLLKSFSREALIRVKLEF